jgi:hypothetical protein
MKNSSGTFNPHKNAIKIIQHCRTYSHAKKELKKYWLTKGEKRIIIKLAKETGKEFE